MYRTDFWTLWEKARVGCFERTALKHVYYLGWNRSPAQVGCVGQVLWLSAMGRPRGIGWRGRWEGRSRWGTRIYPWLIHINVWQNPLQYCKVINLQLIKINEKKFWCTLNFPVLFKIPLEILSIYKLCSCLECIFIYTHSCVCVCVCVYSRFKMESYSCHSILNFFFWSALYLIV